MDADECLAGIVSLEPMVYSLKPSYVEVAGGSTRKRMGLLAQPLEAAFAHAVHTAAAPVTVAGDGTTVDDMKYVDYTSLVAPLIGAVKALSAENRALAAEVKALSEEVKALSGR